MKLKRAIWIGIVMYAVSFVIGLIPLIFIGVDTTEILDLSTSFFIIGMIISVILAAFFTLVYLRDKGIKPRQRKDFISD